jgi:hypothetical protein
MLMEEEEHNISLKCGCEFDEQNKPLHICEIHACWLGSVLEEMEQERKLKEGGY